ncbi:hypothetical protein ASPWEDRAFT_166783 [Aspergillus wentii DTO 134E9]|uniref:Homeobox domain-containing protein n=1 Tax=Aspergillus wentii DTO 134E9 TaxID=1073089 RepID=A0A1L9S0M0_ASPWE|nr:uncharacterized protein ASPWEDRAFT_166783 [Aspergillus wentii DTO 134E9]OJJ40719.1 hypothetical protein ASPWEDRAFT_166783 [Aspergillus wentii DTO 134E9]
MAISYAGLPTDHAQTLPSFRELLPAHLHDEIESTSGFYTSPRHHSHERPTSSSHDLISDPRALSGRAPYGSPSKLVLGEAPRDYSVAASVRADTPMGGMSDHSPLQSRMPNVPQGTSGSTPRYASRGPSPILPPIRDLQSLPERNLNPPSPAFAADPRGPSRADPFAARAGHVDAHGFASASYSSPMGDRRNVDSSYMGGNGPALMHNQSAYHYPVAYQSDSEQPSPQLIPHAPQSNFGILGDSIDPKNKRRRGNLPKPVTDILRAWFHDHLDHPYPSEEDKQMFMTRTGLSISQISNWFINARRRQLPALRNQMRNGGSDVDPQRQSPFSDMEQTSSESMPSPRH